MEDGSFLFGKAWLFSGALALAVSFSAPVVLTHLNPSVFFHRDSHDSPKCHGRWSQPLGSTRHLEVKFSGHRIVNGFRKFSGASSGPIPGKNVTHANDTQD